MDVLRLGAPSLTGVDANELVSARFGGAPFPLKVKVQNLVFMMLTFPEVNELHLRPIGHDDDFAIVTIRDADHFQRLASSIAQVAELNGKAELVEISEHVDAEDQDENSGHQDDEGGENAIGSGEGEGQDDDQADELDLAGENGGESESTGEVAELNGKADDETKDSGEGDVADKADEQTKAETSEKPAVHHKAGRKGAPK